MQTTKKYKKKKKKKTNKQNKIEQVIPASCFNRRYYQA